MTRPAGAEAALRALFARAVEAVSAEACLPPALAGLSVSGQTLVISVGKAGAAMAAVAAAHLPGPLSGLVVTRVGHAGPPHTLPAHFEFIEAGHPVPDDQSVAAAERAMALAGKLGRGDRLLMLISGGGSALLSLPVPGIALADKQVVTRALLRSGARIEEINCVRKHLSRVKGGRLAVAAAPALVTTLIISDVPGDDPSLVASGPTVTDETTLETARAIIERYGIPIPANVAAALENPANETPAGDVPGLADGSVRIVATARDALDAAGTLAVSWGYELTDLGDHLQAEARHLGAEHAALARTLSGDGEPRIILSGGETTVRVSNPDGRGGRNLEYLLGLAIALDGTAGIFALACDTDGIDGTEDNAGGIVTPDTLARAQSLGLDPAAMLDANDAYGFFEALGDLVIIGPTRTNVNDFRAILIDGPIAQAKPDSKQ